MIHRNQTKRILHLSSQNDTSENSSVFTENRIFWLLEYLSLGEQTSEIEDRIVVSSLPPPFQTISYSETAVTKRHDTHNDAPKDRKIRSCCWISIRPNFRLSLR
jgi:hypothetical protein